MKQLFKYKVDMLNYNSNCLNQEVYKIANNKEFNTIGSGSTDECHLNIKNVLFSNNKNKNSLYTFNHQSLIPSNFKIYVIKLI